MAPRPDIQYVQFYTVGTAARKLAAPTQYIPNVRPRTKARKKTAVKVYPVETLAILTAFALLVTILIGAFSYKKAAQEYQTMCRYVTDLENQRRSLADEYEKNFDENTVLQTAASTGMVKADQVQRIYISVSEPAAEPQEESKGLIGFLTALFA